MECRRRKLPRAGTRRSSILSYVPLVHITCDAKPLIASRSLTMQSSERAAAIHSATPFQVTGSPDPNLVSRIDAEAILPTYWIQPKPIRS